MEIVGFGIGGLVLFGGIVLWMSRGTLAFRRAQSKGTRACEGLPIMSVESDAKWFVAMTVYQGDYKKLIRNISLICIMVGLGVIIVCTVQTLLDQVWTAIAGEVIAVVILVTSGKLASVFSEDEDIPGAISSYFIDAAQKKGYQRFLVAAALLVIVLSTTLLVLA